MYLYYPAQYVVDIIYKVRQFNYFNKYYVVLSYWIFFKMTGHYIYFPINYLVHNIYILSIFPLIQYTYITKRLTEQFEMSGTINSGILSGITTNLSPF